MQGSPKVIIKSRVESCNNHDLPFCQKTCHSQSLGISHSDFHYGFVIGITDTSVTRLQDNQLLAYINSYHNSMVCTIEDGLTCPSLSKNMQ